MNCKTIYRFWASSIAAEMEYRINFVVSAITSLGNLVGSIFTLSLLWNNARRFPGYSWNDALMVVALFTILEGVASALLSPNLSRIVQHVQRGTLDFILLKPMDSQLWLSLRQLSPWGLPNIALGLILLLYAGIQNHLPLTAYLLGLLPILLGLIILYCIWFAVATTTIWFTKIWNATEVLRGFLEAGRYPVTAYPPAYQFFFTFILPVAFLTTIPVNVMRGSYPGTASNWIVIQSLIAFALLLFTRWFWRFALRSYTSASS